MASRRSRAPPCAILIAATCRNALYARYHTVSTPLCAEAAHTHNHRRRHAPSAYLPYIPHTPHLCGVFEVLCGVSNRCILPYVAIWGVRVFGIREGWVKSRTFVQSDCAGLAIGVGSPLMAGVNGARLFANGWIATQCLARDAPSSLANDAPLHALLRRRLRQPAPTFPSEYTWKMDGDGMLLSPKCIRPRPPSHSAVMVVIKKTMT